MLAPGPHQQNPALGDEGAGTEEGQREGIEVGEEGRGQGRGRIRRKGIVP